jgi:hypothetical protein
MNDPEIEQGLYQAYIRSNAYEDNNARDSTHVTYVGTRETWHPHGESAFRDERRMARVIYFISYHQREGLPNHLAALVQLIRVERAEVSDGLALFKVSQDQTGLPLCVVNVDVIVALLAVVPSNGFKYFSEKQTCFLDTGGGL